MYTASVDNPKVDILIVDDTLDNLNLLSTMLSKVGYGVRKAINGQMALIAAQTVIPDIILLDINMPGMNGYEVCEQLKQIPETLSVPVIFLSALDDVFDKVKAFQMGGADYITKPFQIEEMLVRIQNQLTIRRLQTQLELQNIELQQALTDLKATQTQLIQKEKMNGLGQLIAGIAHEINNPISFIACNLPPARQYILDLLNVLELYQQKYPNPDSDIQEVLEQANIDFLVTDLKKLMGSMQTGADRIRAVILALRIFSRLGEAEIKAVNLNESIDSVLLLLQYRLEASRDHPEIQVIRDYDDLPLVNCYASLLNQVFLNILMNALDALEGKIKLDEETNSIANLCIWICTKLAAPNRVLISIRDNGIGMLEEVRSRIYEPFFTTKPIGKGSGLGLSTSYQIVVERHGGQLTCQSALGQGTEFIIEIPFRANEGT